MHMTFLLQTISTSFILTFTRPRPKTSIASDLAQEKHAKFSFAKTKSKIFCKSRSSGLKFIPAIPLHTTILKSDITAFEKKALAVDMVTQTGETE